MSRETWFHKEKTTTRTQKGICRISGAPKIRWMTRDISLVDPGATRSIVKEIRAVVFLLVNGFPPLFLPCVTSHSFLEFGILKSREPG